MSITLAISAEDPVLRDSSERPIRSLYTKLGKILLSQNPNAVQRVGHFYIAEGGCEPMLAVEPPTNKDSFKLNSHPDEPDVKDGLPFGVDKNKLLVACGRTLNMSNRGSPNFTPTTLTGIRNIETADGIMLSIKEVHYAGEKLLVEIYTN